MNLQAILALINGQITLADYTLARVEPIPGVLPEALAVVAFNRAFLAVAAKLLGPKTVTIDAVAERDAAVAAKPFVVELPYLAQSLFVVDLILGSLGDSVPGQISVRQRMKGGIRLGKYSDPLTVQKGNRVKTYAALYVCAESHLHKINCAWEISHMGAVAIGGSILILLGVLGFAIPIFSTEQTTDVVRIGELKLQTTESTSHVVPPLLGGGAIALGIALVGAGLYRR